METVSMNDGLDGRDTVAFGLGASEVGVFVLALLGAYAVLQIGLPGVLRWAVAGALALTGAALAWGRMSGRSLLEWMVLMVRFLIRTHHLPASVRAGDARRRLGLRSADTGGLVRWFGARRRGPAPRRDGQSGAVVIPLPLRRHSAGDRQPRRGVDQAVADDPRDRRARVIAFFSLNGGSGRTTLAVEVAALMAVRGAAALAGPGGPRVGLLDLTNRSPAVALRLGISLQSGARGEPSPVRHSSGLIVFAGPRALVPSGTAVASNVGELVAAVERAGVDIVFVDIDCDLNELCVAALRLCHRVYVTVTPNAGGVVDAYRSTAVLRRLGLRDRLGYVVNRSKDGQALDEAMGDLGGVVVAAIPEDVAFVVAENTHRVAALDGDRPLAAAIADLARQIEGQIIDSRPAMTARSHVNAG